MSATELLNLLQNYFSETDSDNKIKIQKEFAHILNQYIDFRINAILNEKHQPHNRNPIIENYDDVVNLIDVLDNAPEPPDYLTDLDDWIQKYYKWYNLQRTDALNYHTYKRDTDISDLIEEEN